ncbi:MAG: DUF4124 domain-containing protein [Betaproteobacteria bacterium]|nr:DUF4124 domain-containing protein [Betaproteobacteria bacterium]MDE2210338.1 DUF4124 domain-containing protein [Betaproteobacteria bacterium]
MTRRDFRFVALRRILLVGLPAVSMLATAQAQAAICKYIDPDGNVVYSNVAPAKGLRKLSCDIVEEAPRGVGGGTRSTPTPEGFPRVSPEVQKSRDDTRRKILDDELANEEKLLTAARAEYGNGAPQPLPDEKNDAEKYRQRIAKLRQAVTVHERNIDALRKEIATTR